MELLQYLKVIKRNLWLILLIMAIVTTTSYFYTLNQRVTYISVAKLLLNPTATSASVPFIQNQVSDLTASYSEYIHTRSFLDAVTRELPFKLSVSSAQSAVSTQPVPNTYFYLISAEMESPEEARQLVSAVIKVFLSSAQQASSQVAEGGVDPENIRKRLQDKLEYIGQQIKLYQAEIDELLAKPQTNEHIGRVLNLRGQLISLQQAETDTLAAFSQLEASNAPRELALVVDQPSSGSPTASNVSRNLMLATVTSLLIGIGVAVLRNYLDRSVRTPQQVEEVLAVAPLASIPILSKLGSRWPPQIRGWGKRGEEGQAIDPKDPLSALPLVTLQLPNSPGAESFRVLRTKVLRALWRPVPAEPSTIGAVVASVPASSRSISNLVVTSCIAKEGKSFIASNLAVSLAKAGKRVLLVDADLRLPTQHRLFDLPNDTGFTNLASHASPASIVQRVPGLPNLAVITSGPTSRDSVELLHSPVLARIMAQLSTQADIVIYDSPPSAPASDAAVLALNLGRDAAVLLVVSAGMASVDLVAQVSEGLEAMGIAALLPVLNRVHAGDLRAYFYPYQMSPLRAVDAAGARPNGNGNSSHPKEDLKSVVSGRD